MSAQADVGSSMSAASVLLLSDDLIVSIAAFLHPSSVVAFAATCTSAHLSFFSDRSVFEYFWRQQFNKHCAIALPPPSDNVKTSPSLAFHSLSELLHSDVASVVSSLVCASVSETSSDNIHQTVRNTLTDSDHFWSSTGHSHSAAHSPPASGVSASEREWSETLVYRMIFPCAIVTSVSVTIYQCTYQVGLAIFAPTHVQFHVGYAQNKYHYSTERLPCHCVATPQTYNIPCVPGQYIALQMFDAYETQRSDELYYQCVRHVAVNGLPLSLLKDDSAVSAHVRCGSAIGRRQLLEHFIRHGNEHGLVASTTALLDDETEAELQRIREAAQDTDMMTIHDDDDEQDDDQVEDEDTDDDTELVVPIRFRGRHVNQPPSMEAFPIIHSSQPTTPTQDESKHPTQDETVDAIMTDNKQDDSDIVTNSDEMVDSVIAQLMSTSQCQLINQWFLAVHDTLYKQVKPLIDQDQYAEAGRKMEALSTLNSVIYPQWNINSPAVYHPRNMVIEWIYDKTKNIIINRDKPSSFVTHPLLIYLHEITNIWTFKESFIIIKLLSDKFQHFIVNNRHILLPLNLNIFMGDYLLSCGQVTRALDIYGKYHLYERMALVYILLGRINEALSLSERVQFLAQDYMNLLSLSIYYLLLWKDQTNNNNINNNNGNININNNNTNNNNNHAVLTNDFMESSTCSIIQTAIIIMNSPAEFNCRGELICMELHSLMNGLNTKIHENHVHSDQSCSSLMNRFYNESRLRAQRMRVRTVMGMESGELAAEDS